MSGNLNNLQYCKGFIPLIVVIIYLTSCNPARFIEKDKNLLTKVSVECNCKGTDLKTNDFYPYIKQQPNTRIFFFFRPYLWVHIQSQKGKERKWKNKLNEIVGEEPVIYDSFQKDRSIRQLTLFLKNKGYYSAQITDSVKITKQKAKVLFTINPGRAIRVSEYLNKIQDSAINELAMNWLPQNSLIKVGQVFDMEILQSERSNLVEYLRNHGYFSISRDNVDFFADTISIPGKVALQIKLKIPASKINSEVKPIYPLPYHIRNVFVYPEFGASRLTNETTESISFSDTISYRHLKIIQSGTPAIKNYILSQAIVMFPGQLFSQKNIDQTYQFISDLQQYKFSNIQFVPITTDSISASNTNFVDCSIQLVPDVKQSYQYELEGTNSSGNIGFGGSLNYSHKNIFKGAEIFNIRLKGSLQAQSDIFGQKESAYIPNTVEYGVETSIILPRFLFPFIWQKLADFHPRTNFSLSYNFQNRPDYTRTIAQTSIGYFYRSSPRKSHVISPVVLNIINLKDTTADFAQSIANLYIRNSYEPQVLSVFSYSFIYNTQESRKITDYSFVRWNIETGGNSLFALNSLLSSEKAGNETEYFTIFNTRFAQFAKTDLEFIRLRPLRKSHYLVFRTMAGIGIPYGNSQALPFVKKYFAGGANSVRAWQVRSLGPGSFPDTTAIPNLSGDIKLEANIEYRFPVIWKIKGALFIDAGNIWALNSNTDNRTGAAFEFNRFYNEIAIGTGFGTRFDFEIFIFRFDLGLKLRDPTLPEGSRWKLNPFKISSSDFALNLGIGYPF